MKTLFLKLKTTLLLGLMLPILSIAQVRPHISSFDSDQRSLLATLMQEYITYEVVEMHCNYTALGGPEIHGDFDFLPFHRLYLQGMEDFLFEKGYPEFVPLPKWDQTYCLPTELRIIDDVCTSFSSSVCSDANFVNCDTPEWCPENPLPYYLSTEIQLGDYNDICDWDMDPIEPSSINCCPSGLSRIIEGHGNQFNNIAPLWSNDVDYHNRGHFDMGGAMGVFTSPSVLAFWLWHANVDDVWKTWEENCTQSNTKPVDLWMQDTDKILDQVRDRGEEPNIDMNEMSASQDMWVRNQEEDVIVYEHQNAEFHTNPDLHNYVYVRVRNRGYEDSTPNEETKLNLYWIKSTTGVIWPDSFDGGITTSDYLPLGGLIGSKIIPSIKAGGSEVVEFEWDPVDPSGYPQVSFYEPKDFCLVARIESDYDPMTIPETDQHWVNVKNNNNIIWKNIVVLDVDPNNITLDPIEGLIKNSYGSVYITNPTKLTESFNLSFLANENPEIVDYADVTVSMTQDLWDLWQESGGLYEGEFKDVSREADVKKIRILSPNTSLLNLNLPSEKIYPIAIEFNLHSDYLSSLMPEYKYLVQQRYSDCNNIMGSETYIVKTGNRNPIDANAGPDKEISEGETSYLSATDVGVPAIYYWYDQNGILIFTGKDLTVSPDITKKYKLEVISTLDGVKDFDEVNIKVKEFEILSLSPNPASSQVNLSYKAGNASSAYLMITQAYGSTHNYILDVNQSNIQIDLSDYTPGIYSAVLICNGTIVDSKTLIVN